MRDERDEEKKKPKRGPTFLGRLSGAAAALAADAHIRGTGGFVMGYGRHFTFAKKVESGTAYVLSWAQGTLNEFGIEMLRYLWVHRYMDHYLNELFKSSLSSSPTVKAIFHPGIYGYLQAVEPVASVAERLVMGLHAELLVLLNAIPEEGEREYMAGKTEATIADMVAWARANAFAPGTCIPEPLPQHPEAAAVPATVG